ncbi:TPA: helix-turn-helix domain-containing protein, partial [Pseudomonas aeruginosa]
MKYVHFDARIQGENVSFDAHSGERLREERENAGLTQQQMADEAGVRREMWSKYERGVAAPGAAVFEALARKGLDLVFILTGMRQVQSAPLAPD